MYKNKEALLANKKKWRANNPEKIKIAEKRKSVAYKLHPIRQVCTIDGCSVLGERHHPDPDIYEEIVWLCKFHHEREHHGEIKICTIDGCEARSIARGLCHNHYQSWWKKKKRIEFREKNGYKRIPWSTKETQELAKLADFGFKGNWKYLANAVNDKFNNNRTATACRRKYSKVMI